MYCRFGTAGRCFRYQRAWRRWARVTISHGFATRDATNQWYIGDVGRSRRMRRLTPHVVVESHVHPSYVQHCCCCCCCCKLHSPLPLSTNNTWLSRIHGAVYVLLTSRSACASASVYVSRWLKPTRKRREKTPLIPSAIHTTILWSVSVLRFLSFCFRRTSYNPASWLQDI